VSQEERTFHVGLGTFSTWNKHCVSVMRELSFSHPQVADQSCASCRSVSCVQVADQLCASCVAKTPQSIYTPIISVCPSHQSVAENELRCTYSGCVVCVAMSMCSTSRYIARSMSGGLMCHFDGLLPAAAAFTVWH